MNTTPDLVENAHLVEKESRVGSGQILLTPERKKSVKATQSPTLSETKQPEPQTDEEEAHISLTSGQGDNIKQIIEQIIEEKHLVMQKDQIQLLIHSSFMQYHVKSLLDTLKYYKSKCDSLLSDRIRPAVTPKGQVQGEKRICNCLKNC